MKATLCNAFSLNMLPTNEKARLAFTPIDAEKARYYLNININGFDSAIGHADTANLFSEILGLKVECNRVNVTYTSGFLIVGQYSGPRLPEGSKVLPEGATIQWWIVTAA